MTELQCKLSLFSFKKLLETVLVSSQRGPASHCSLRLFHSTEFPKVTTTSELLSNNSFSIFILFLSGILLIDHSCYWKLLFWLLRLDSLLVFIPPWRLLSSFYTASAAYLPRDFSLRVWVALIYCWDPLLLPATLRPDPVPSNRMSSVFQSWLFSGLVNTIWWLWHFRL